MRDKILTGFAAGGAFGGVVLVAWLTAASYSTPPTAVAVPTPPTLHTAAAPPPPAGVDVVSAPTTSGNLLFGLLTKGAMILLAAAVVVVVGLWIRARVRRRNQPPEEMVPTVAATEAGQPDMTTWHWIGLTRAIGVEGAPELPHPGAEGYVEAATYDEAKTLALIAAGPGPAHGFHWRVSITPSTPAAAEAWRLVHAHTMPGGSPAERHNITRPTEQIRSIEGKPRVEVGA